MGKQEFADKLAAEWKNSARWKGITRPYKAEDVYKLRGTVERGYTLAKLGSARLWKLLHDEPYVHVLSAVTGNQAIQQVKAGLKAIYVSGWQVAADMNNSLRMYPDQSLYPSDSVPFLLKRINNALQRADQIHHLKDDHSTYWMAPLVADAEAGFGGPLNAFEIMRYMIEEGAAGVHFEDQLASVKKCGHLGGKVLVPTREFITKLVAARLAADVSGVDTLLVARTDADSGSLITSDIDPYDRPFIKGPKRTHEGFFEVKSGLDQAIARALAYAPYADLLWFETSKPSLAQAKTFSEAIHKKFPGKLLAYNCSPSFNWKTNLSEAEIGTFQNQIGAMGYKFQFVTLSGFHVLNHGMFNLAKDYKARGMAAYSKLQVAEFESEKEGYEATRHQEFVGTGYFDAVTEIASQGQSSTLGMEGSTEKEQF
ncbi:MAG TPA: isocitrate lyase [Candidatus Eisenbacteria bacterium]|nr:isocitrate lyase [Candidatus Eisenbacteria bacterium]